MFAQAQNLSMVADFRSAFREMSRFHIRKLLQSASTTAASSSRTIVATPIIPYRVHWAGSMEMIRSQSPNRQDSFKL